jgi:inhibitor of cysteine peptidase
MKNKLFIMAMVIMLVFAAGCEKVESMPTEDPQFTPKTLTEADNGSTITLNLGELLVVRLEGNPTTGYTWEAQDLDALILQQTGETEFESSNTSPGVVGAGGTQVLTFEARSSGTTILTIVYHRPWETGIAPIDTFSITITVP